MKKSLFLVCSLFGFGLLAAEDVRVPVSVDPLGFPPPIPVSVAGFSGEADSVLRFDLSFMGFEFVAPDKARYNIQKNSAAGVGASVIDPLQPASARMIYNKSFTGGGTRQQTHALADDLAKTLTQKPGIAQTRIACKVQATGIGAGEIVIADYDGFNPTPVTKDNVICAAPSWSGRNMLFYMSHKIAGKPDVLSHNLGTGARKRVTTTTGDNFTPAVSPDGRRVAMILSKSGSPNLYVCDPDGGNLKQLTTTHDGESCPAWSPDSRTICVVSRQSGKPALYTIPAGGGALTRLSVNAPSPTEPDWSPDGKYLVFTSQSGAGFQICVTPMEGPLRGTAMVLVAGEDPVWAPNSRAVMFVRTVNYRRVLTLLDVPSKQTKEIARITGSASQPSWAR